MPVFRSQGDPRGVDPRDAMDAFEIRARMGRGGIRIPPRAPRADLVLEEHVDRVRLGELPANHVVCPANRRVPGTDGVSLGCRQTVAFRVDVALQIAGKRRFTVLLERGTLGILQKCNPCW